MFEEIKIKKILKCKNNVLQIKDSFVKNYLFTVIFSNYCFVFYVFFFNINLSDCKNDVNCTLIVIIFYVFFFL